MVEVLRNLPHKRRRDTRERGSLSQAPPPASKYASRATCLVPVTLATVSVCLTEFEVEVKVESKCEASFKFESETKAEF